MSRADWMERFLGIKLMPWQRRIINSDLAQRRTVTFSPRNPPPQHLLGRSPKVIIFDEIEKK